MFENKRILVTGSSRGIGFATAKAFLMAKKPNMKLWP